MPWFPLSWASLAMRADFPEPDGPYKRTGHLWLTANRTLSQHFFTSEVNMNVLLVDISSLKLQKISKLSGNPQMEHGVH